MREPRRTPPDVEGMDVEALRGLALELYAQLLARDTEVENLKLLIAKLKRLQFGRKSEKLGQKIEQLELQLEELESKRAAECGAAPALPPTTKATSQAARRPLPAHLPRETTILAPGRETCPGGGALRALGEDVSESLEYVPGRFKVLRQVRPKLSCRRCDTIVQAAALGRAVERSLAGPGLLAHVAAAKYADHLPLRLWT